jgi:hypothetical protein
MMAHFAELDSNNQVKRVIVVNNNVLDNAEGLDGEATGIAFCQSIYGEDTVWKQTSYNNNFRGYFAGIGTFYDPDKDEFVDSIEITE